MKLIKNLFFVTISTLICVACNNSETASEEVKQELIDITFSSEINPSKTDWKLGLTYHDTLEFISFDDNYDYAYGVFKTKDGNTVSLICDVLIESKLKHGIFAVQWRIDSLFEAGEGDESYYDERLLDYTVIEEPKYFGDFLSKFIKAYSNNDSILIQDFINNEVGFYSTFKPGLYCVINQQDYPITKAFINLDCNVLDEALLGNYCDGYPNIENGLYFENVNYDDVPIYESPVHEHVEEYWIPLSEKYHKNEFKKVTIVLDEYQYAQLYFIRLDKRWYLWAEDLCDCSA